MLFDELEVIAANSFRNFHAKGLDYLCLQRSSELTVKAYFYDRPLIAGPEVVCPHDHRYPFVTKVVAGRSGHQRYYKPTKQDREYPTHQMFDWFTPLNGGCGFEWSGETVLRQKSRENYVTGQQYYCRADEIHTISIPTSAILLLFQFADVVPLGASTRTFVPGCDKEPPCLDGLYDRMTVDYARALLSKIPQPSNERKAG